MNPKLSGHGPVPVGKPHGNGPQRKENTSLRLECFHFMYYPFFKEVLFWKTPEFSPPHPWTPDTSHSSRSRVSFLKPLLQWLS